MLIICCHHAFGCSASNNGLHVSIFTITCVRVLWGRLNLRVDDRAYFMAAECSLVCKEVIKNANNFK